MRGMKVVCCAAALVACLAPGARADEWNKRTFLTFSGPVQVPGVTLPAGTYTFEIANPDTTRHVIRVSSQDGTKTYGMFMTIPNDRMEPPDDNVVMFAERPAGIPQAIQVWYYPGDRVGEEFVYPKDQAARIAKATHKSVLATESATNASASEAERMSAMKGATVGRVDESGRMTSDDRSAAATTTAPSPTPPAASDNKPATTTANAAPTTAAPANTATGSRASRSTTAPNAANQSVGTTGQAAAGNQPTTKRRLPQTASNLSLALLLSGLCLIGAGGVRYVRRVSIAK